MDSNLAYNLQKSPPSGLWERRPYSPGRPFGVDRGTTSRRSGRSPVTAALAPPARSRFSEAGTGAEADVPAITRAQRRRLAAAFRALAESLGA